MRKYYLGGENDICKNTKVGEDGGEYEVYWVEVFRTYVYEKWVVKVEK